MFWFLQNKSEILFGYIDTLKSNSLGGTFGYHGGKAMAQYYTKNQAQPQGVKLPLAYMNPNVMAGVVVSASRPLLALSPPTGCTGHWRLAANLHTR